MSVLQERKKFSKSRPGGQVIICFFFPLSVKLKEKTGRADLQSGCRRMCNREGGVARLWCTCIIYRVWRGKRNEGKKTRGNYHRGKADALADASPKILGTRRETQIADNKRNATHIRYRRYTVMEQRRQQRDALERYGHTNAFICRGTSGFVGRQHREIIFLRAAPLRPRRALNKNT